MRVKCQDSRYVDSQVSIAPYSYLHPDFGLSKIIDQERMLLTACGTPAYVGMRFPLYIHPHPNPSQYHVRLIVFFFQKIFLLAPGEQSNVV